ncbi:MAG TPA: hypothetical protein PLW83_05805, partial [Deltaproteobacteria bacterium]|nr:hypothetical protein [Deltaproteobacteria bacterium]
MKKSKAILPGLVVAGIVIVSVLEGARVVGAEASAVYPELQKFTDCLDIIEKYYVDRVDPHSLIEG